MLSNLDFNLISTSTAVLPGYFSFQLICLNMIKIHISLGESSLKCGPGLQLKDQSGSGCKVLF